MRILDGFPNSIFWKTKPVTEKVLSIILTHFLLFFFFLEESIAYMHFPNRVKRCYQTFFKHSLQLRNTSSKVINVLYMGSRIHFEFTIVCNKKVSSRHSVYRRLRLHLLQPPQHICHKRLYFRDTLRLKERCLVRILRVWWPFSQFPPLSKCYSFNLTLLIKTKKYSFNCSLKNMNLHKKFLPSSNWNCSNGERMNDTDRTDSKKDQRVSETIGSVSTIPYGKAVPCADALAHARPTTRKSTATVSVSPFCRGNIAGSEREMHANGVFPYL